MKITVGKPINPNLVIVGIICLTFLEAIALIKGIDGIILTAVVAAIAAAIGVVIPTPKFMRP